MADLALSSIDSDILIENDKLSIVDGDDALVQHLTIRLQFFLSEWFLDLRVGIGYLQEILIKNPNLIRVRTIFREAILTTTGIASLERFDLTVNSATRGLAVSFTAAKDDGGTLDFSREFIIQ